MINPVLCGWQFGSISYTLLELVDIKIQRQGLKQFLQAMELKDLMELRESLKVQKIIVNQPPKVIGTNNKYDMF